jgi:hypothetical protein
LKPLFSEKSLLYIKQPSETRLLPQPDFFLSAEDQEVKKEIIGMITRKYELSTCGKAGIRFSPTMRQMILLKLFMIVFCI